MDGAKLQFATVSLSGTANPGDTLRLEGEGLDPATCRVKPDGSWTMRDVRLSPENKSLTVVNVGHPARTATVNVVVSDLQPITVVAPLQGETLEARFMEVTGKSSPERLVCLRFETTTTTERSDSRGSFRFRDVELDRWGEQHLVLFYAEDPTQGAAELVVNWPGLDLPSLVDPVTRARLEPGADVVRCSACYTYCYRVTWKRFRSCPRCTAGTRFWERPDSRFHVPRSHLRTE